MKNIKYIFTIALVSILLGCNTASDCLSPNNDCNCNEGYEGEGCNKRITEKFIGKYSPQGSGQGPSTSPMSVIDTVTQLKTVYFRSFNANTVSGASIRGSFYGIVDGDHITIPNQIPTNNLNVKQIEGEVCVVKDENTQSLIMKLLIDGLGYRIVYLKI